MGQKLLKLLKLKIQMRHFGVFHARCQIKCAFAHDEKDSDFGCCDSEVC